MAGLNLTPNEVIGYRLKPDYNNWTVVCVKKHGASSKNAGELYETPVGYYRTLPMALAAAFNLEARLQMQASQNDSTNPDGHAFHHDVILEALRKAEAAIATMAAAFEVELAAAGISLKGLTHRMRPTAEAGEQDQ